LAALYIYKFEARNKHNLKPREKRDEEQHAIYMPEQGKETMKIATEKYSTIS
jgi:hypothetical protein